MISRNFAVFASTTTVGYMGFSVNKAFVDSLRKSCTPLGNAKLSTFNITYRPIYLDKLEFADRTLSQPKRTI